MTDYANDWVARRAMIAHAETSQGSRFIKDPIAHTNRMMKRYGPEYREAVGLAYGERHSDRCSAVVRDKIDEALSAQHSWQTIAELDKRDRDAFRARYCPQLATEYDL